MKIVLGLLVGLGLLSSSVHAGTRGLTCELAYSETGTVALQEDLPIHVFIDHKHHVLSIDGEIWGNHHGIRAFQLLASPAVAIGYHFGSRYLVDFRSETVQTAADIRSGTEMKIGDAFGSSEENGIPAFGKYVRYTLTNCR